MDMAFIDILMEGNIKVIGKMTIRMDLGNKVGLIMLHIKDIISMGRKMVRGFSDGLMGQYMKDN